MRNRNLAVRRNVRNNKHALVESIMAKIKPIVKKALNEDDEYDDEEIIMNMDEWSMEITLNVHPHGRVEASSTWQINLTEDVYAGSLNWYLKAVCTESDDRRYKVGDELEFEVEDVSEEDIDSFDGEELIEDAFNEAIW